MALGKMSAFGESLVEPDPDANTLLTELDKGIAINSCGKFFT